MKKILLIISISLSVTSVIAQPSVQMLVNNNENFITTSCSIQYPEFGSLNICNINGVTSTDSILVDVQLTQSQGQPNMPQIFKSISGVNIIFPSPVGWNYDSYQISICANNNGISDCKLINVSVGASLDNMICTNDTFVVSVFKRKDNFNIYLIDNDKTSSPCNINGSSLREIAINRNFSTVNYPFTGILSQTSIGLLSIENTNSFYKNKFGTLYQSDQDIDFIYTPNPNIKYNIRDTFTYIASNSGFSISQRGFDLNINDYPQTSTCGPAIACGLNDTAIAYISIDTLLDNLVGNCYVDVNNDNQLNYLANPFYAEPVLPNVKVTLVQNNETQITNLNNLFSGNVLNNTFTFNDLKLNNYAIQLDYDTSLYELKPGFNLNGIILTNLPLVNGERVFNIPFRLKNVTPVYKSFAVFNSNPVGCSNGTIQSNINVINLGNVITNNTIKVKFDTLMTNIVCSPLPSIIDATNKIYTWNLTSQNIGSITQINVQYSISNPLSYIGKYINVTSTSYTKDTFNVIKDSVSTTFSDVIRCAYDPNDKLVNINAITPTEISNSTDLIYTIRFQNTGNASAENVFVTDILSSNLDVKSFQFLASSHAVSNIQLTSSNEVKFAFNGINLPDSNSNEVASHGYITFKIKPKNTLTVGDTIANKASIYFDNNPAIITNTVVTRTAVLLAIKSNKLQAFKIYPNPSRNYFTITLDNTSSNQFLIQLINVLGKIEKEVSIQSSTSLVQNNDLKGLYIVRIIDKSTNEIIGINKILFE
jgi:uncharacterized repeat protein (TIGR01451 family)